MKKFLAIFAVVVVAFVSLGVTEWQGERQNELVAVTETYTVCAGDTVWSIAAEYHSRDARNLYFPEFKSAVEHQNPFLLERRGLIHPGDQIIIEYMISR